MKKKYITRGILILTPSINVRTIYQKMIEKNILVLFYNDINQFYKDYKEGLLDEIVILSQQETPLSALQDYPELIEKCKIMKVIHT